MTADFVPGEVRAKRAIADIKMTPYGFSDLRMICEPSADDICRAIREGRLEHRNFQGDLPALQREWLDKSENGTNREALRLLGIAYHAERIAYFVVNGWDDSGHPIRIDAKNALHDGGHRIRAALFKGVREVDVIVTS